MVVISWASIESIFPLIEIHNLVFNGVEPHGAELLANNALHAGVEKLIL